MEKKGKDKKGKDTKKKSSPVPWIVAAVVMIIAALAISGNLPFVGGEKETGKSFNLTGKETRPVLNPSMFTGQTRLAYAAAKRYPEILNEVYCYCFCDEPPFHHKTLLSCFTDKHGAG
jgi:flagellar basal body-associated protein FliL